MTSPIFPLACAPTLKNRLSWIKPKHRFLQIVHQERCCDSEKESNQAGYHGKRKSTGPLKCVDSIAKNCVGCGIENLLTRVFHLGQIQGYRFIIIIFFSDNDLQIWELLFDVLEAFPFIYGNHIGV